MRSVVLTVVLSLRGSTEDIVNRIREESEREIREAMELEARYLEAIERWTDGER